MDPRANYESPSPDSLSDQVMEFISKIAQIILRARVGLHNVSALSTQTRKSHPHPQITGGDVSGKHGKNPLYANIQYNTQESGMVQHKMKTRPAPSRPTSPSYPHATNDPAVVLSFDPSTLPSIPSPLIDIYGLIGRLEFWRSGMPVNIDIFLAGTGRKLLERWVVSFEVSAKGSSVSHSPLSASSSNNGGNGKGKADLTDLILLVQSLYSYVRLMPLHSCLTDRVIAKTDLRYCISTADGYLVSPHTNGHDASQSDPFTSNASSPHHQPQHHPHQQFEPQEVDPTSDTTSSSTSPGSSGFHLGAKLKVYKFKPASTSPTSGKLHLSVVYDANVAAQIRSSPVQQKVQRQQQPHQQEQQQPRRQPSTKRKQSPSVSPIQTTSLHSGREDEVVPHSDAKSPQESEDPQSSLPSPTHSESSTSIKPPSSSSPSSSLSPSSRHRSETRATGNSPKRRSSTGSGSPFPSPTLQRRVLSLSHLKMAVTKGLVRETGVGWGLSFDSRASDVDGRSETQHSEHARSADILGSESQAMVDGVVDASFRQLPMTPSVSPQDSRNGRQLQGGGRARSSALFSEFSGLGHSSSSSSPSTDLVEVPVDVHDPSSSEYPQSVHSEAGVLHQPVPLHPGRTRAGPNVARFLNTDTDHKQQDKPQQTSLDSDYHLRTPPPFPLTGNSPHRRVSAPPLPLMTSSSISPFSPPTINISAASPHLSTPSAGLNAASDVTTFGWWTPPAFVDDSPQHHLQQHPYYRSASESGIYGLRMNQYKQRRESYSGPLEPFGSLVGSYEESILSGRMSTLPSKPITFIAEIGVIGFGKCRASLKCPPHINLSFPAYFYELQDDESPATPYVGSVDLETLTGLIVVPEQSGGRSGKGAEEEGEGKEMEEDEHDNEHDERVAERMYAEEQKIRSKWPGGYRLPPKGQLQIIIKNPSRTAVKVFLIPYDFHDMPPGTKTFLRQKSYTLSKASSSSSSTPSTASTTSTPSSSSSKRLYLAKTVRIVFSHRAPDGDEKLRVVCEGPKDPKYMPLDAGTPVGAGVMGTAIGKAGEGTELLVSGRRRGKQQDGMYDQGAAVTGLGGRRAGMGGGAVNFETELMSQLRLSDDDGNRQGNGVGGGLSMLDNGVCVCAGLSRPPIIGMPDMGPSGGIGVGATSGTSRRRRSLIMAGISPNDFKISPVKQPPISMYPGLGKNVSAALFTSPPSPLPVGLSHMSGGNAVGAGLIGSIVGDDETDVFGIVCGTVCSRQQQQQHISASSTHVHVDNRDSFNHLFDRAEEVIDDNRDGEVDRNGCQGAVVDLLATSSRSTKAHIREDDRRLLHR
ncbi:hypothetical protein HK102_011789 [Quaeritorhiza haematococci]|nr:hypothetical protein HK102_011789 [Quaeritorhiza haematococci]